MLERDCGFGCGCEASSTWPCATPVKEYRLPRPDGRCGRCTCSCFLSGLSETRSLPRMKQQFPCSCAAFAGTYNAAAHPSRRTDRARAVSCDSTSSRVHARRQTTTLLATLRPNRLLCWSRAAHFRHPRRARPDESCQEPAVEYGDTCPRVPEPTNVRGGTDAFSLFTSSVNAVDITCSYRMLIFKEFAALLLPARAL
jgi:hypothetical protein